MQTDARTAPPVDLEKGVLTNLALEAEVVILHVAGLGIAGAVARSAEPGGVGGIEIGPDRRAAVAVVDIKYRQILAFAIHRHAVGLVEPGPPWITPSEAFGRVTQTIAPAHDDPLGQSVGEAERRADIVPASRKDVVPSGASGSRAHIFDGAEPSSEVWIWQVGIEVGQPILIFEVRRVAAPANTVVQGQAARDLPRVLRKCAHVVSGGNGDK